MTWKHHEVVQPRVRNHVYVAVLNKGRICSSKHSIAKQNGTGTKKSTRLVWPGEAGAAHVISIARKMYHSENILREVGV